MSAGSLEKLIRELGDPVESPEEETFDLFSQSLPSQNLGFIDSKAQTLDLSIAGRDLTIHQSPAVLSSNRAGGTTGAVVWKISPLFSEFISSPSLSPLLTSSLLTPQSQVLELGCGISALVGLLLAPKIGRYVLTDQPYVSKLVELNIAENHHNHPVHPSSSSSSSNVTNKKKGSKDKSSTTKGKGGGGGDSTATEGGLRSGGAGPRGELVFRPLDWETTRVTTAEWGSYDAVIACDCIYNDSLIDPLVDTCVDVCRLRTQENDDGQESSGERPTGDGERKKQPTVCVIAQQLRDDQIFEGWLTKFSESFVVWRVPDKILPDGLKADSGFVVHLGVLKDEYAKLGRE